MSAIFAALPVQAQITAFKHIVIIVQENRTPDNLFNAMCQQHGEPASCGSLAGQYDIQTSGWKTKNNENNGSVDPVPVDLGIGWDIEHHHNPDWVNMCDLMNGNCQMDGAATENCKDKGTGGCSTNTVNGMPYPEFTYVQRYNGTLDVLGPYITLAQTYGWANLMFATNQGPSFEAHQFIYGGTSAPTAADDGSGVYAADNPGVPPYGCLSDPNISVQLITLGVEIQDSTAYPCFQHRTLGTLFAWPSPAWRYYTPTVTGSTGLWTAPNAILSECGGSNQNGGYPACTGTEFNVNVVTPSPKVLTDIGNCQLQSLSWVIPNGTYSDHAAIDTDAGPYWVAYIVNSIGQSSCKDSNGLTYWQDTAIIITWDDWGGWYDHEAPSLDPLGYQLGFRVPLLVVSAYGVNNTGTAPRTCQPSIDGGDILDFGSIANFIEGNYSGGWTRANEGQLHFADARALTRGQNGGGTQDLSDFFDVTKQACPFNPIIFPPQYDANYFFNSQPQPPDDD